MNLLMLGTGAADWPLKPECDMTEDGRRFSSMIIDGTILLDAAPQSYDFAKSLNADISGLSDFFITHTHGDHYNKEAVLNFARETGKLRIWCHRDAVGQLGFDEEEKKYFEIKPLDVFDTFETAGYEVTAVSANHLVEDSPEQPLHYIFKKDGKTYMCGGDGGVFTAHTWEYMRTQCFDGIIFDATVGDSDCDWRLGTHNSIPMLRLITAALREGKMIHDDTFLAATHLAMTLHAGKEETENLFAKIGMTVLYDGKEYNM